MPALDVPTVAGPDRRRLLVATGVAFAVAGVLLVVAILPAEYGVDPTGIGDLLGFKRLSAPPGSVAGADNGSRLLFSHSYVWTLTEEPLLQTSGHLSATSIQARVSVPVTVPNVTLVRAELDWVDDETRGGMRSEPDVFEFALFSPSDARRSEYVSAANGGDGNGNLTATLQWRSIPFPNASQPSGPLDQDRSATGNWTAQIRLSHAGGFPDGSTDDGNSWALRVFVQAFQANLTRVALTGTSDTVTLRVAAGGMVEYKLGMAKNATMSYAWRATAPLTFDFHGDDPRDPNLEPMSHQQGVAAQGTGTFQAPFAGRHGWWWYNRSEEPVTVTLQTSGDYVILGVV